MAITRSAQRVADERVSWWPLVAIVLGVFMLMLDATVVTVALPDLREDLGTDLTGLQWVVNAYTLAMAAGQLTAGSLADRLGRRRVLLAGLVTFALASVACAAAPSTAILVAARAVQGMAGALLFAATLALLAQCYRGTARGIAFGVRGTVAGAAVVAGPVLGGALVSSVGWRWIFLLNVPVAALALVLAWRTIPGREERDRRPVDLVGALLLGLTLLALVYALLRGNTDGWTSGRIAALAAVAVAGGAGFVTREARAVHPMLDLGLFRRPAFTGTQLGSFAIQAGVFALFVYLSLYFQTQLGYSAFRAGLCFLPVVVPILLAGPIAGAFLDRVPPRVPVAGGLTLATIGLLTMHRLTPSSDWTALAAGMVLTGFACGIALPALGSLAVEVDDPRRLGMASGVNNTVLQVGITLGIAVNGALLGAHPDTRSGFVDGLNQLFVQAAAVTAAGAVLTWLLLPKRQGSPARMTGGERK